jgi:uncharacterized coiled-coil protein SlyX
LSGLEDRISKLEEAINALRERVARVEGIVEQMDKRLNHIEAAARAAPPPNPTRPNGSRL